MKNTCFVASTPTKALFQISIIIYKVLSTILLNTLKLAVNIPRSSVLLRPLAKSTCVLQHDKRKKRRWHLKRKTFSSSQKRSITPDLRTQLHIFSNSRK